MLGTWVTYSTVYTVFESWKKTNDTTMDGRSIMIMTGDTVLNEQMNIQAGRSYISLHTKNLSVANADVENFKLTKQTTDKIIFEKITTVNPESITYNFITPETMRILMKTDGKSVESYNMKKIIKK